MTRDGLYFEWDRRKESANRKKHGVSFDEARTAFLDENARLLADPDHSNDEDRFVLLGLSSPAEIISGVPLLSRRPGNHTDYFSS